MKQGDAEEPAQSAPDAALTEQEIEGFEPDRPEVSDI
jgi:hypothetical protein